MTASRDINDLIDHVLTGHGTPLMPFSDFMELCARAFESRKTLHTLEAFEFDGDSLIPRIDAGIFGEPPERLGLCWGQRDPESKKDFESLIEYLRREDNSALNMRFRVWLGSNTDE